MDYFDVLEQLSGLNEADLDEEFSIARALSLPLEFLVSFVRNRRESELLIKISKSAASLDCLIKHYESIALRSQKLQEAWDALWLSQEPYVIAAIPIIGCEMTGANMGRSILLEKTAKEIRHLEELGKLLHHYIDVNYALVEELHMEGIDRLAISKLLLVAVEKEVTRRITHICSNEGVRNLSPIRQFLCHLSRKPASPLLMLDLPNQSGTRVNSTTDGSSKVQNRKENAASEERDTTSPECHSFCSKCAATDRDSKQIEDARFTGIPILSDILVQEEGCFLDLFLRENKDSHAQTLSMAESLPKGGIVNDVRHQSSSASEERLPSKGPDAVLHVNVTGHSIDCMDKEDNMQDKFYDNTLANQIESNSLAWKSMPLEKGVRNYYQDGKNLGSMADKGSPNCVQPELPGLWMNRQKHPGRFETEILHQSVAEASKSHGVYLPSGEGKMNVGDKQAFHILNVHIKCDNKKRSAETLHSIGDSINEMGPLKERNSKRILVKRISESENTAVLSSREEPKFPKSLENVIIVKDSEMVKTGQQYLEPADSADKRVETNQEGTSAGSEKETSLSPCSCGQQTYDTVTDSLLPTEPNPLTQDNCRDFPHSISQQKFNQQSKGISGTGLSLSLDREGGNEIAEPFGIQIPESPILATQ